jgi:ferredoxin
MKTYFLPENELKPFVSNLMEEMPVVAPVAKQSRFVFDELKDVKHLRLDYDTTVLPPKKVFFPPRQDLLHFEENSARGCIDPEDKVLLGVHPYDIKAISMLDYLFAENHKDYNYLANREHTTIIGSNVQNHYKRAFFGSMAQDYPVKGHDMFLTDIGDGYVAEVLTEKGENLLQYGNFEDATKQQIIDADKVNEAANKNCPQKVKYGPEAVEVKMRDTFKSKIWEELSEDCFSCGSCNIVCPTCYCFDVQDWWNMDQESGKRSRRWDACLTTQFAEVSVQGGTENFREDRAERYRHRFMRKATYLNEKLGAPACVGCGRCSGACTADIADPVRVINRIMEEE